MKIAVSMNKAWSKISGHAGRARQWFVYDCAGGRMASPERLVLSQNQLPHYHKDDGPHPLRGMDLLVTGSAGEGYFRHAEKWGARVVVTGELLPEVAVRKILGRQPLLKPRFDITTAFCKLRDMFPGG